MSDGGKSAATTVPGMDKLIAMMTKVLGNDKANQIGGQIRTRI